MNIVQVFSILAHGWYCTVNDVTGHALLNTVTAQYQAVCRCVEGGEGLIGVGYPHLKNVVTAQLNLNWSWSETLKWVGSHPPHHPTPPTRNF